MAKRYMIDRTNLPYDAFVPDPSWLGPVEDADGGEGGNSDGDKGAEADTDGDQGTGREPGEAAAQ